MAKKPKLNPAQQAQLDLIKKDIRKLQRRRVNIDTAKAHIVYAEDMKKITKEAIAKMRNRTIDKTEKKMLKEIEAAYVKSIDDVSKKIASGLTRFEEAIAESQKPVKEAIKKNTYAAVEESYNLTEAENQMMKEAHRVSPSGNGGEDPEIGITIDKDNFFTRVDVSQIDKHIDTVASNATRARQADIQSIFQNALKDGRSITEVAREVRSLGIHSSRRWAERIARTESAWAHNRGVMENYSKNGVTKLYWYVTPDDALCDFCQQFDGKVVETLQPFAVEGEQVSDGGDKELSPQPMNVTHPPLHPNCRCTILPG